MLGGAAEGERGLLIRARLYQWTYAPKAATNSSMGIENPTRVKNICVFSRPKVCGQ